MKEANGLIGMVKYTPKRSWSKYVIGREGWRTMIVSKLVYVCGVLAWYQRECDDLDLTYPLHPNVGHKATMSLLHR